MTTAKQRRHPSTSSVTSKGQVTIPAHIREFLGIRPHDRVEFRVTDGRVEIAPEVSVVERTKGSLKEFSRDLTIQEAKVIVEEEIAKEALERGR